MHYTIYKITNQINGKVYIGSHKTKDLDDKYMGSGKYLKHAQKKHGIDKFTREILFVFDNPTEMYQKEAELVNEDFLTDSNTYNIKLGGFGGFDFINGKELNNSSGNSKKGGLTRHITLEELGKRISEGLLKSEKRFNGSFACRSKYPQGTFTGKTHTEDTKKRVSEKAKERMKDPTKNSQYGTMWITNEVENKKIQNSDDLPAGWRKGRVLKV